jgi:CBS domain-containing protein
MHSNQFVRNWMSKHPITVPKNATLPEAHQLMHEHKVRRLPVMDGDKLVGIITRSDVRGAEPSEATSLSVWELNYLLSKLTVDQIMSRKVLTVTPDTPIAKAAKLMLDNKIAGLPVMDGETLAGIITESDIFRMVVDTWQVE